MLIFAEIIISFNIKLLRVVMVYDLKTCNIIRMLLWTGAPSNQTLLKNFIPFFRVMFAPLLNPVNYCISGILKAMNTSDWNTIAWALVIYQNLELTSKESSRFHDWLLIAAQTIIAITKACSGISWVLFNFNGQGMQGINRSQTHNITKLAT